jgi:allene oxide cyclase-like protein
MRRRFTFSNIVSVIALFAAVGGGAYAATSLPRNSVGSAQVRNGSLRLIDLAVRKSRLRVLVKVDSAALNDTSPTGPSQGDVLAFKNRLRDTQGKTIGRLDGFCVFVDESSRTCTESYLLPGGKINIVGTTGFGAATVIGGTGRYAGATGTVDGKPVRPDGTIPNLITLRIPR